MLKKQQDSKLWRVLQLILVCEMVAEGSYKTALAKLLALKSVGI
jgi:hypothetical protein